MPIIFLGFTYCEDREISYSDARSLVTFSGISYCDKSERVFIFAFDTKKKNNKTIGNLVYSWGGGGGLRPFAQISLLFRCSFYYKYRIIYIELANNICI
jgi:hypothetical protein